MAKDKKSNKQEQRKEMPEAPKPRPEEMQQDVSIREPDIIEELEREFQEGTYFEGFRRREEEAMQEEEIPRKKITDPIAKIEAINNLIAEVKTDTEDLMDSTRTQTNTVIDIMEASLKRIRDCKEQTYNLGTALEQNYAWLLRTERIYKQSIVYLRKSMTWRYKQMQDKEDREEQQKQEQKRQN